MGSRQSSLGSAAFILMLMVIGSGLLGLVRLRVLNGIFTPEETGVFFAAFRLPNIIFDLLATGSLSAAFIPVFTKYVTKGQEKAAWHMASTIMNLSILVILVLAVPLFVFTSQISRMFAPGFTEPEILKMASFTRIMLFLQVVPLVLGNYVTGMLQSYNLFLVPALAPILYNTGMIIGILLFASVFGLESAVIGVGIGAVLFLLVQLPLLFRTGYRHSLSMDFRAEGVAEVGRLLGPRIFGMGISQIDVTVDLILSSLLGARMVTVFYLAQSLQQLPVRLFGLTISQAALPTLSKASAEEDLSKFRESVLSAYTMILFFVLPASVFFIVMRIPIVRIIYGASRFDWEATVLTAMTLSTFSVSLFAQSVSQVFTRGFYALFDSRTPVAIGVVTILLNSGLSVLLIVYWHLPVWALGLSTSVASIINALLLALFLYVRVGGFDLMQLVVKPLSMAFAALASGSVVYILLKLMDELVFDTTRVFPLIMLTAITTALGLLTYGFLSWVFDVSEVQTFIRIWDRIRKFRFSFSGAVPETVGADMIDTSV